MIGYVLIIFILLILVSILICLLSINKKFYLGGGQLAILNDQNTLFTNTRDTLHPFDTQNTISTNTMSKINSMQKINTMAEIQVLPTTIAKKLPPTDEELDRMFSMDERSRPYTYDELRVIYYKLQEPFKNLTSKQLWSEYMQYLTQKTGGGICSTFECTQINDLINRGLRPEHILNDNKIELLNLFPPFDERCDTSMMYQNRPSPICMPWQKLTQLTTYQNIYGMQGLNINFRYNCDRLIRFMRFLYDTKKIKHIVFIEKNWAINNVDEILSEKFLFTHDILRMSYHKIFIEDYTSYSFSQAMDILALVDYIVEESVVFNCTGGWGRTGSALYLIIKYKKCIEDQSLLLQALPMGEEELGAEFLATNILTTEYSIDASKEFFGNIQSGLLPKRLNTANEAIAHRLALINRSTGQPIRYRQYNNIDNLSDQIEKETEPISIDEYTVATNHQLEKIKLNITNPNLKYIDNYSILVILPQNRIKFKDTVDAVTGSTHRLIYESEVTYADGVESAAGESLSGKRYIIQRFQKCPILKNHPKLQIPLSISSYEYGQFSIYIIDIKTVPQELLEVIAPGLPPEPTPPISYDMLSSDLSSDLSSYFLPDFLERILCKLYASINISKEIKKNIVHYSANNSMDDPKLIYISPGVILKILPVGRDKSEEMVLTYIEGDHKGEPYILQYATNSELGDISIQFFKKIVSPFTEIIMDTIDNSETFMQKLVQFVLTKLRISSTNGEINL